MGVTALETVRQDIETMCRGTITQSMDIFTTQTPSRVPDVASGTEDGVL